MNLGPLNSCVSSAIPPLSGYSKASTLLWSLFFYLPPMQRGEEWGFGVCVKISYCDLERRWDANYRLLDERVRLPCSGKESRETQEGQASVGDPRASIFQVDTTQTRVQAPSSCLANFLIGFESHLPLKRALLLRSALDNGGTCVRLLSTA